MPVRIKDDGRPKVLLTKEEVYKRYSKGYRLKRKKRRKRIFSLLLLLLILILLCLYLNGSIDRLYKIITETDLLNYLEKIYISFYLNG